MNRKMRVAIGCIYAFVMAPHPLYAADVASLSVFPARGTLQVAFSPEDNIEALILDAIGRARDRILIQAYLLTSRTIIKSLVDAKHREIDVRVLVDAEQQTKFSSTVSDLLEAGIPVWGETKYQNAHNKIIIIDAHTAHGAVITGSYNFTWAAQHKNAENVLIFRDNPDLVSRYAMNWEAHRKDAVLYKK